MAARQQANLALMSPKRSVPAPPNRGRLYYDHQIADAFFEGLPNITDKVRWVRRHLPKETRIQIGRASAWYEADIRAHLNQQRGRVA